MIIEEHIKLIKALLTSTQRNLLVWKKTGSLSYSAKPNASCFILDKYFSKTPEFNDAGEKVYQTITCINLSVFDSEDKLLDEIICCSGEEIDKEEDFTLFSKLYDEVELQYERKSSEIILPKLVKITEELEKNLH